ncbi:hypothetical protein [Methylorubrum thiocyanatum]|uniref:hypothetical protein n=1 Tax=Methylorubrum thiocyanatum TaxID=47958 RepID=UPI0035C82907
MTEAEIDALAGTLADMTEDQEAALQVSLLAIKAERARREEERLARLRALTDEEVVEEALEFAEDYRVEAVVPKVLAMLRDAGFVRGAVLERAYREGYERGFYDAGGSAESLPDADGEDYVRCRGYDLREIEGKAP